VGDVAQHPVDRLLAWLVDVLVAVVDVAEEGSCRLPDAAPGADRRVL